MELWGLGVVSTGSASGMVRGLRQPSGRGDMRRHGGADSMPALHDTVSCEPLRAIWCGLHEERLHARARYQRLHGLVSWRVLPWLETARGVKHLWQQSKIADRVEEDAGSFERPMHREVDVGLIL